MECDYEFSEQNKLKKHLLGGLFGGLYGGLRGGMSEGRNGGLCGEQIWK